MSAKHVSNSRLFCQCLVVTVGFMQLVAPFFEGIAKQVLLSHVLLGVFVGAGVVGMLGDRLANSPTGD